MDTVDDYLKKYKELQSSAWEDEKDMYISLFLRIYHKSIQHSYSGECLLKNRSLGYNTAVFNNLELYIKGKIGIVEACQNSFSLEEIQRTFQYSM